MIFLIMFFFWKIYNFMDFERRKYLSKFIELYFFQKTRKILGRTSKLSNLFSILFSKVFKTLLKLFLNDV